MTIKELFEQGYEDIDYETFDGGPYYTNLEEIVSLNYFNDVELNPNTNNEECFRYVRGQNIACIPEYISDWIDNGKSRIRFLWGNI